MLNLNSLYSSIQMYKSSSYFQMDGLVFDSLALSIAGGIDGWVHDQSNVAISGLSVGTLGAGTIGNSRLYMLADIQLMHSGLVSAGVNGPLSDSLAAVVAMSTAHAFSQHGSYIGTCQTVGNGNDVSKVTMSNTSTLIASLTSSMASNNISGSASQQLATGLALGIASLVLTVTGDGKVIGVSGSSPSSGSSFSRVG